MAGKTPLLLAMVLFAIGASGLALTSAEHARWGPFHPPAQTELAQRVIVVDVGTPFVVPPLDGLLSSFPETRSDSALLVANVTDTPAATPTPVPPIKVFGLSADDGGVAAAAVTPPPPPPLRIMGIASDAADPVASPEATDTPAPDADASETPAATETPAPDKPADE